MRSAIIAIAASMAFAGAAAWADVNPTVTTAGSAPQIVLPKDGDEYSALAARAAAQDQGVDFRALRFAWLKSAAHKHETASEVELRSAIFTAVKAHDDQGVRAAAVKMISAIYVNRPAPMPGNRRGEDGGGERERQYYEETSHSPVSLDRTADRNRKQTCH
ncbi:MAG TPA: hypothetical protein VHZ29_09095, partial [Rhizomicrobium sp.]|nr:hypothetical protein [Rhizomicrobium sp.]